MKWPLALIVSKKSSCRQPWYGVTGGAAVLGLHQAGVFPHKIFLVWCPLQRISNTTGLFVQQKLNGHQRSSNNSKLHLRDFWKWILMYPCGFLLGTGFFSTCLNMDKTVFSFLLCIVVVILHTHNTHLQLWSKGRAAQRTKIWDLGFYSLSPTKPWLLLFGLACAWHVQLEPGRDSP